MVASVGTSLNSLLAANFSTAGKEAASQQLRAQEASIKSQAQAAIGKAGPNATVTASYSYSQGPDGQLYVTGVTVSSQKKVEGAINPVTRDGQSPYKDAFRQAYDERQQSLKDYAKAKSDITPSEEVQLFSIDQFREGAFNSVDNLNRAKYQAADLGTRIHEGEHFRAGGGVASAPEYTFEEGPDGVFYAVGGEVDVKATQTTNPEKAAAQAETIARAATAAGDASAADIGAARDAQYDGASIRSQKNLQQQVADLYQRNYKALFNGQPEYSVAA